jgi:precorrin-6B methylase 2
MNIYKKLHIKFPLTYNFLRDIYHSTFIYKQHQKKQEQEQELAFEYRNKSDKELMHNIFHNQYIVHYGPFQNMKYIEYASGSRFLPKILGSYEQPIHDWLYYSISKQYETIIDIGCAEGYYAVGMALKSPKSRIYAFDTNEKARKLCHELATLNNVADRITISSICTTKDLDNIINNNTLIICDIEGSEFDLIDPAKSKSLNYADMIIESHDYLHGFCNITEELINRFYRTHIIEINIDYKRDLSKYEMLESVNNNIINEITNEGRGGGGHAMKWLWIRRQI